MGTRHGHLDKTARTRRGLNENIAQSSATSFYQSLTFVETKPGAQLHLLLVLTNNPGAMMGTGHGHLDKTARTRRGLNENIAQSSATSSYQSLTFVETKPGAQHHPKPQ